MSENIYYLFSIIDYSVNPSISTTLVVVGSNPTWDKTLDLQIIVPSLVFFVFVSYMYVKSPVTQKYLKVHDLFQKKMYM